MEPEKEQHQVAYHQHQALNPGHEQQSQFPEKHEHLQNMEEV